MNELGEYTFGSVCDGIGCGHLGFEKAGVECVWSFEIEPFPSAVLEYRFPDVENFGDMNLTAGLIERGEIEAPDMFIGGTPCQAFSVAGKRKGLEDARGNLSLTFCRIADSIDAKRNALGLEACVVLWENVPGVLSDKGNAFGCFLGELAGSGCQLQPPGKRWSNAGCVFGPSRTVAWRVLDSQWFGVAQRRKRVFVVASAGNRTRPEEILFEREGVRRDSPPSRETREGVADDVGSGVAVGHWDGGDCHPALCAGTKGTGGIAASNQELFSQRGSGLVPVTTFDRQSSGEYGVEPIASTVAARDYKSASDLVATYDMRGRGDGNTVNTLCTDHASRPSDFCPVVAFAQNTRDEVRMVGGDGSIAGALAAEPGMKQQTYIAMSVAQNQLGEVRVGKVANTLNTNTNATGRNTAMVAIGWSEELTASVELAGTIQRGGSGGRHEGVMTPQSQVRRLTPVECERLQGLPDNWTKIPWRIFQEANRKGVSYESMLLEKGKHLRGPSIDECPDGPRYKGIGNGQTVQVMQWLANRIKRELDGKEVIA